MKLTPNDFSEPSHDWLGFFIFEDFESAKVLLERLKRTKFMAVKLTPNDFMNRVMIGSFFYF
ncbi:MAG: hypothetical protein J6S69_03305 [Proteobacteria bacterium]|nr:hypothetical protein [Pseudomonadota bacterium]